MTLAKLPVIAAGMAAMIGFPAGGFALGYLVLSSHNGVSGMVGMVAGAVLFLALVQMLSRRSRVAAARGSRLSPRPRPPIAET